MTEQSPLPSKSPISFRPSDLERSTLERLAKTEGVSASEVLRRGLELTRAQQERAQAAQRMPFYAIECHDAEVHSAVERAADAACEILDELMRSLGSQFPERDGIDSNFRGLLGTHLLAMLCGEEHAHKGYSTPVKPLFANHLSFGTVPAAAALQGYTMMRTAEKVGGALYFSEGAWVRLPHIDVGGLYTSRGAAVSDVLEHLRKTGESIRENPMQLVLIDFSGDELALIC